MRAGQTEGAQGPGNRQSGCAHRAMGSRGGPRGADARRRPTCSDALQLATGTAACATSGVSGAPPPPQFEAPSATREAVEVPHSRMRACSRSRAAKETTPPSRSSLPFPSRPSPQSHSAHAAPSPATGPRPRERGSSAGCGDAALLGHCTRSGDSLRRRGLPTANHKRELAEGGGRRVVGAGGGRWRGRRVSQCVASCGGLAGNSAGRCSTVGSPPTGG